MGQGSEKHQSNFAVRNRTHSYNKVAICVGARVMEKSERPSREVAVEGVLGETVDVVILKTASLSVVFL